MTEELPRPISFDGPLGRRIVDLHVWAVRQGLLGAGAAELFDSFCRRLVESGLPLWRGYAAMRTLHPQWGGYGYTWRREGNAIEPAAYGRGDGPSWSTSPFAYMVAQASIDGEEENPWRHFRRRLTGPEAQLDFPVLEQLAAEGGSDYFAQIVRFGAEGDLSQGTGIAYSFAIDRPGGFRDDDLALLKAVLPALSLAMMTHAGHTIASSLLGAYLGCDAGRRVHSGAIERGSVERMRAALWYADIRGFTAIADTTPGPDVIELLNETFEAITAPLRQRGGQVLKFMGDGLLATFPFEEATKQETCRQALDAAAEAMQGLDRLNDARVEAGKPVATVDVALHLGEVLYGNIGAVDRLDFTVIGPGVNEVARIELLCEPLGYAVLVSAELAATVCDNRRLEPLGRHKLRGVRETRAIYALIL
jgi:adenylate cyclase